MISIPIVVHTDYFKWQTDLFWFNHCMTYNDPEKRVKFAVVRRNLTSEPRQETLQWPLVIPHVMCESVLDYLPADSGMQELGVLALPLNIQTALLQMIDDFDDDEVLEVNDSDMFHFRAAPQMDIGDDELYVCALYEEWHLKSQSEYKNVIEPYFKNGGGYYNGGFVPIIGKARTIKKILQTWTDVHIDILKKDYPDLVKWWAGMYALQVACEQHRVKMVAKDYCYVPGLNSLQPHHYICHYTIDSKFNKKTYPNINTATFEDNLYYERILQWLPVRIDNYDTLTANEPAAAIEPVTSTSVLGAMDPAWQRWLIRTLARGIEPSQMVQSLVQHNMPQDMAQNLVKEATSSPFFTELKDAINETQTREWLLLMLDAQFREGGKYGPEIKRIKAPKFKKFLKEYYYENVPVVLKGAVKKWPVMKWTPQGLKERIGSAEVQVQFGREAHQDYEREAAKLRKPMPFDEYVDLVLRTEKSNDFYMTAGNWEKSKHAFVSLYDDIRNIADGYIDDDKIRDHGFFWLGPKGTITPLHHDLTNNLFVQVYGRKRFIMIPACQVPYTYNNRYVFCDVDIFNPDYERYPELKKATVLDFVVEPGDVLFIPNCWLHAVEALDTSISITFNNFHAMNYQTGYPGQQRYIA